MKHARTPLATLAALALLAACGDATPTAPVTPPPAPLLDGGYVGSGGRALPDSTHEPSSPAGAPVPTPEAGEG